MEVNNDAVDALIAKLMGMKGGSRIPPLPPSTPPANDGGMEARIAVLEAHVEHIRTDLARLAPLPMDVAVLKEKVVNLPTKMWMFKALAAMITASSVVTGLIIRCLPAAP